MRVLILGADGTFGHAALAALADRHEVFGTCATGATALAALAPRARRLQRLAADQGDSLRALLVAIRPDAIVNAIGLVKQRPGGDDPERLADVNGRFPHRLADVADEVGAKVVHLSSDCVFSGRRGNYGLADNPDPVDAYGRSKLAGEIVRQPHLTLRISFIGRQLRGAYGLLEWFLAQADPSGRRATVPGYTHAAFSGLTTAALADVIGRVLEGHFDLAGVHHVAAVPITKHELLVRVRDALHLPIDVVPEAGPRCDRSLDGSGFTTATGIVAPGWTEMIGRLAADAPRYAAWRLGR